MIAAQVKKKAHDLDNDDFVSKENKGNIIIYIIYVGTKRQRRKKQPTKGTILND